MSQRWGKVVVSTTKYADGALAVLLTTSDDDLLARLSVNTDESTKLPPLCFYAKDWSENAKLAEEALDSGLFRVREDIYPVGSGFVYADCWEIVNAAV